MIKCGRMNTQSNSRGVLIVLIAIGSLSLFYIAAGLAHPAKTKVRALRINSVNAAPRVVMSMALSNTSAAASTLPSTGK